MVLRVRPSDTSVMRRLHSLRLRCVLPASVCLGPRTDLSWLAQHPVRGNTCLPRELSRNCTRRTSPYTWRREDRQPRCSFPASRLQMCFSTQNSEVSDTVLRRSHFHSPSCAVDLRAASLSSETVSGCDVSNVLFGRHDLRVLHMTKRRMREATRVPVTSVNTPNFALHLAPRILRYLRCLPIKGSSCRRLSSDSTIAVAARRSCITSDASVVCLMSPTGPSTRRVEHEVNQQEQDRQGWWQSRLPRRVGFRHRRGFF